MSERLGPLIVDLAGAEVSAEDRDILRHPLVGGVILFTRNYESPAQLRALCNELAKLRPRCPLLVTVDHEGGRVQRFREGFTELPAAATLCDDAKVHAHALTLATELRAVGVDLSFAPVLDIGRGRGLVIGDRALADDAEAVARLGSAWIDGMWAGGMAACVKHFPGHGGVAADSHLELPVDERPLDELRAEDLVPFTRAIAHGVESVMMAHVAFPAVDDMPASLSRRWVAGLLRGELGFDGAVICDDLSMAGVAACGDPAERARTALSVGCDALPVCNDRAAVVQILDALPAKPDTDSARRLEALRGR